MTTRVQRIAACAAVNESIAKGEMIRPTECEACGSTRSVECHHWSYKTEHWLDVIPMCASCHRRMHNGRIPEPRTGRMYPTPFSGDARRDWRVWRWLRNPAERLAHNDTPENIGASVIRLRNAGVLEVATAAEAKRAIRRLHADPQAA